MERYASFAATAAAWEDGRLNIRYIPKNFFPEVSYKLLSKITCSSLTAARDLEGIASGKGTVWSGVRVVPDKEYFVCSCRQIRHIQW
jgi:hypothetical protein